MFKKDSEINYLTREKSKLVNKVNLMNEYKENGDISNTNSFSQDIRELVRAIEENKRLKKTLWSLQMKNPAN